MSHKISDESDVALMLQEIWSHVSRILEEQILGFRQQGIETQKYLSAVASSLATKSTLYV